MAEQPLDASTRLAAQRTRLAQERTLMAWIRTSTSLIAFGFTIFKFFQYLATIERRREPILSPWVVGMMMILVGLTGLTLAWIQHRQEMKALKAGNWSGRGGQPGLALGEHDEGVEEVPAVFGGGG